MLAVVLLAVLAAVQVECAPNQLWPVFDKVSHQPTKKPVFSSPVNKETESKNVNPSATQHAYEQFINTWLRQASLTLNRPDLLKFLAPSPVISNTNIVSQEPVFVEQIVDVPVETIDPNNAFDVVAIQNEQFVPVDANPISVVFDTAEPLPVTTESTGKQLLSVPNEQTPEGKFVKAEKVQIFPEAAEVVSDETPLTEELLIPVAQEEISTPVTEEPEVISSTDFVTESIPSLVDQDTATVLVSSPPTPLVESDIVTEATIETTEVHPTELLQPIEETNIKTETQPIKDSTKSVEPEAVTGTGKSFSSVPATDNVISQEPFFSPRVLSQSAQPQVPTLTPNQYPAPIAAPISGLTYTLQFFPSKSGSHFFVSTPIGG